ncbi:Alpha/Beta hydrolase protein [Hygrophoropsis aurantiaca]|uniref:Alpha/Beta hydrolase protein n=1 Tax=Hygrophoropsis aurantiaca TaxID=72124 RepID=A0ACB8AJ88_9AGAM|nr:Alpha/Beta hydrolase protein [Hygrophoropsis aurantiaca]
MNTLPTSFKYKDSKTSRGFNYHYVSIPAQGDKPSLLFIHGFPSTSYDWYHQINYFSSKGYGIIAPDMLGYGQTDKPTDVQVFQHAAIAQDLIDILDTESVGGVFAVGHDWGSGIASILSLKHSSRFLGFAWIAVPYSPPGPFPPVDVMLQAQINGFGRPITGYWTFFEKEVAASIIENNIDSLLSAMYPRDPDEWLTLMNLPGEMQIFVEQGKRTDRALYLTEKHYNHLKESFKEGGMASPMCWYRCMIEGVNSDLATGLSEEDFIIKKPAFFAQALRDRVAIQEYVVPLMQKYAANGLTIEKFNTGHWVHLEEPDNLSVALELWMSNCFSS